MRGFKEYITGTVDEAKKVTHLNVNMTLSRSKDKQLISKIEKTLKDNQIYFDNDNDGSIPDSYNIFAGFTDEHDEIDLGFKLAKQFKKMGANVDTEEF